MRKIFKRSGRRGHRGFTIIELMTVVLVVAVLVALALPSFTNLFKRFRVSTAASEISHALQFARANAITTRSNVGMCNATSDPTNCDSEVLSGGIRVWRDPNNTDKEDSTVVDSAGNPVNPLRIIPASSFNKLNVEFASDQTKIIFSPLGFVTDSTGGTVSSGAIYVWPVDDGNNPATASYVNTVCLGIGGKISIVAEWVDISSTPNRCT
ncbi:MAG: GspH/FimT family pseudopilin [Methylobacillus sp.]|jgi:type IV fimbrial biogenesis protein FimT|nr:GspH/FimT family pseudopilin [Methylobacillus sp.]